MNHGGDYPETYEYVGYLREQGFEITEITPPVYCGCTTIEQYIHKYKFAPARNRRWCTQRFKVIPFLKYIDTPCIAMLGISHEERHRAENRSKMHELEKNVEYQYPLIDAKMNRDDCITLIKEHELKVPNRSTCFFCPFQNKQQLRELYLNHPDLYRRAVEIEDLCSGGGKHFLKNKPLARIVNEGTLPLSSYGFGGDD